MAHLSGNVNSDRTISLYEGSKKVLRGTVADIAKFLNGPDAAPAKVKKVRAPSRGARWSDASSRASAALEELKSIRGEFEEWKDNLPESLQSSPVGDKLETICDIDIQSAIDLVGELEGADLPMGFGRD